MLYTIILYIDQIRVNQLYYLERMLSSVNFVTNILVTMCNSTSIELYAGQWLVSIHHYFHTATVWGLFPGKWTTRVCYLKRSCEFQSVYSVCRFL